MTERSQTPATKRRSAGGNGTATTANGNGHPNGNGYANGNGYLNGNGRAAANGNGNGNGRHANGNGNGVATTEEVRRIATEMGSAMLTSTSVDTARHSDDVELITDAIADKFDLSDAERSDLLAGARLHDIGKAAIPPEILIKPQPLDAEEWEVMLQHTIVGEQILASVNELQGIAQLVRHSHERWDGDGYPDGLAGEDIPLGSRIIFCADAFHAVRSDRPYRDGRPAGEALTEIRRCSGTQFDPEVVAALETVVRELQIIGPGRRAYRSSRLTALLLALVIGGAGSAVAGSQLFGGDGDSAASDDTAQAAEGQGGVLGKSASSAKAGQHGAGAGEGSAGSASGHAGSGGSAGGATSEGVVLNQSSTGSSSGGSNEHANPDSWAGGGSPGQSGNAPGHGGSCPGNSCNAPGHQSGGAGNSANAPGQQPGGPGNSANAPGQQPGGPGNSANAPGHQSTGPGNSANAPGHAP